MVRALTVLALVAVTAVQVSWLWPMFTGAEPQGADLSIHLAEARALLEAISALDLDLWNPSANAGFPSGYYYQLLPQLLPALLSLATGGALALPAAFKLCVAAPLLLLPLSVFRALRHLGVELSAALLAAVASASVASSSPWGLGMDSLFTSGLYTQAWAMAAYPMALAAGARWIRDGLGGRAATAWGALTALCHPFFAVCAVLATLPLPLPAGAGGAALRRALSLLGAGLLVTAFFWLPMLVHAGHFGGFARLESERGLALGELLRSYAHGRLLDLYRWPWLSVLGGVGLGFASRRTLAPSWLARQALLFAALLALGAALPFSQRALVPPVRFLAPMQLALAQLAALTGHALLSRALGALRERAAGLYPSARAAAALLGLSAAVALLWAQTEHAETRVSTATEDASCHRAELEQVLGFLRSAPPGRVAIADRQASSAHWWAYLPYAEAGHPALRAYGGAALQSSVGFRALAEADPLEVAERYAVRYLLAPREHPLARRGLRELYSTEHHLVLEAGSGSLWALPAGVELSRADERPSWYRARLEVRTASAAQVVLRVGHHPGWRPLLDGRPVPLLRDGDFLAVQVPPGKHKLELRFRRPAWSWLLAFGAVLLLIAPRRTFAAGTAPPSDARDRPAPG